MGHVQRAYDPLLQRNVAIKMLVLDREPTADHIQRMQREVKALARLKHQNVDMQLPSQQSAGKNRKTQWKRWNATRRAVGTGRGTEYAQTKLSRAVVI